ncbi:MAG: glycerol kinase GlpK [Gammaproteobacteria bacterium]|nr:glycerol kinase GlpK [Gammaproteobacteria bacterium]
MKKYILALDQGTTSSRAIVFDREAQILSQRQQEFTQHYPQPGWVEHDPNEIWLTQLTTAKLALSAIGAHPEEVAAIGITNQRETTIVWDRDTGLPIYNAIVWQDRRTSEWIDELKAQGLAPLFQSKTGLVLDAYFSGTKLKWILDHVSGAREKALSGKLAFGTVDSWIVWNLTNRREHVTDESNASRTLLFNIHTGQWDQELLKILDIPEALLPRVVGSSECVGEASAGLFGQRIPIAGIAGDQQAATFGNLCTQPGMVKNTYGTGCFLLMNTGGQPRDSKCNLLSTTGWNIKGKRDYCLEGSVFIGGAVVQWVRDQMKFIDDANDIEALALSVPDNGGVFLVPAFSGLGAPYWDQYARGTIFGLSRGSSQAHIARAALESIAFQVADLVHAMEKDADQNIATLRVDGGACKNNFLMQFQADILDCVVERPQCLELTALGAAYLAGLAVGFWKSEKDLEGLWHLERRFEPNMKAEERKALLDRWHEAVERTRGWIKA